MGLTTSRPTKAPCQLAYGFNFQVPPTRGALGAARLTQSADCQDARQPSLTLTHSGVMMNGAPSSRHYTALFVARYVRSAPHFAVTDGTMSDSRGLGRPARLPPL